MIPWLVFAAAVAVSPLVYAATVRLLSPQPQPDTAQEDWPDAFHWAPGGLEYPRGSIGCHDAGWISADGISMLDVRGS